MKIKAFLYVAIPLLIIACNKPLPDYSGKAFDYTVMGIGDTSIPANDFVLLRYILNVVSGDPSKEPVTIKFIGLPVGIFHKQDSTTLLLGNWFTDSFGARNVTQGMYPIDAVFTSPTTGIKKYRFNLNVTAPIDRRVLMMGAYQPSNTCGNTAYLSCIIDSVANAQGQVRLIDRIGYAAYDTFYASIDCCTNTFIIPTQKVQGATIVGYGSFTVYNKVANNVIIYKTITTDSSSYQCAVTLSHF